MNLSDALDNVVNYRPQCKFGSWVDTLNADDQNLVRDALTARDRYTTIHLTRVFQSFGCPVSESSVRTHRMGECKSCRPTK